MELQFRKCVVAAITNDDGLLLVGERADAPGSWQLPQGGVDEGESDRQALLRELREEIGTNSVEILGEAEREVTYEFPKALNAGITSRYRGQTQRWFKVRLATGEAPNLAHADGEFVSVGWMSPEEVLGGIISWKREAYAEGLRLLGLIGGR